ncbi:MRNA capping enzyme family protein isoform 3 [Hibiscus syriacus]|uniref:mRNA capping enzyme family protein isoform 3 n=1 Tax=Hibiscus syriacus TaxID=106335 RepID=A0A6A2ZK58_HIBSY|nr:MRNA capping enzyme family protein isoform 3 [Hibiscus syriacus]
MFASMDLNASPLPEDDEDAYDRHVEQYSAPEEHVESAVEILRREREERRKKLKKDKPDDQPVHVSQPQILDHFYQNRNPKFYDKSRIPPGWLGCPSVGQEIGCIIPSKTPLGESYNDCVPPGKRYSFKQVIHQQRVLGRKLGLVIDLTNTSRYYQTTDLKKEGIKHVKIQCRGRDAVPDNLSVNTFVYEVSQFLLRQKSKKYILVHCTHGHNRTGYMIVHYLMRSQSISVSQAIKIFSEARPPGIYKPDYIDALYAFYHEKRPEMVVCPPTPEWKRSSDLDLNGEAVPDDDGDGDGDDGESLTALPENHETDGTELIISHCLMGKWPFCERWKMLEKEVIVPRNYERHNIYQSRNPYYRYDLEPFRVRRKDFWLLSTVNKVLKEFIPNLSHEADGLIFQGWDDPYVPRTHEGLLKWKYASMNSVDFLFEIDSDGHEHLFLFERGKKKLMEGNKVEFIGDVSDPPSFSGKIIVWAGSR